MEIYPAGAHGCFTVYRPADRSDVIWLHPGEPVFDRFCAALLARHEDEARRGAFFVDPHAGAPYLFHLARVSVVRRPGPTESAGRAVTPASGQADGEEGHVEIIESRLIGLRQDGDGVIEPCPLEHLLLLRGAPNVAPGSVPLARMAHGLTAAAREWVDGDALARLVDEQRARIERSLPERLDWVARGCDHRTAELIARRQHVGRKARGGDAGAATSLAKIKDEQRRLAADKERRLRQVRMEPSLVVAGDCEIVAHALVLPTADTEERRRHDTQVEEIAMQIAQAHEEASGAAVHDVSRPELARRAGLGDWPGFDLLSVTPAGARRAIEVKGRAGTGDVELSRKRMGQGVQPAGRLLASCRLRLRHAAAAAGAGPRPVREAAREEPRVLRLRHFGGVGAGSGGGSQRGSVMSTSRRLPILAGRTAQPREVTG